MKWRLLPWGLLAVAALVLAALAYGNPATMTQLAEQLWSCF